jgi:hypothetical protein
MQVFGTWSLFLVISTTGALLTIGCSLSLFASRQRSRRTKPLSCSMPRRRLAPSSIRMRTIRSIMPRPPPDFDKSSKAIGAASHTEVLSYRKGR